MIKRPLQENDATSTAADILACGIQSVVLDPAPECVAKLLSLAVDHIDTLLEDWWGCVFLSAASSFLSLSSSISSSKSLFSTVLSYFFVFFSIFLLFTQYHFLVFYFKTLSFLSYFIFLKLPVINCSFTLQNQILIPVLPNQVPNFRHEVCAYKRGQVLGDTPGPMPCVPGMPWAARGPWKPPSGTAPAW